MALKDKLALLNLSEEEKVKAEQKFLATLALVSEDELKDTTGYLNTQGVQITKAKEIKVVANSKEEIAKKFNILGEIHETAIYKQDPSMINRNVIDVYKKIKYCIQVGKNYKREDGTYEPFLFSEAAWQQEFNRESSVVIEDATPSKPLEDNLITVDPVIEPVIVEEAIEAVVEPVKDTKHVDIKEYMASSPSKDFEELEAKTTNFASIRQELEGQLAELDALKSMSFEDEISFADLEPETYGMGRAA